MTRDGTAATAPPPVRALRVVLYVVAGLSITIFLAGFLAFPVTARAVGLGLWNVWPGVLALVVAGRVTRPSRTTFWLVWVVALALGLGALAALGQGDPRGVTGLALPVLIAVLVSRRSSAAFLRHR